jgi:hypothetical protein
MMNNFLFDFEFRTLFHETARALIRFDYFRVFSIIPYWFQTPPFHSINNRIKTPAFRQSRDLYGLMQLLDAISDFPSNAECHLALLLHSGAQRPCSLKAEYCLGNIPHFALCNMATCNIGTSVYGYMCVC